MAGFVSYPARAVTVLDFPEATTPKVEFVYNYSTPSQTTNDSYVLDQTVESEYVLSPTSELAPDVFAEAAVGWPRYVKLWWEHEVDSTVAFTSSGAQHITALGDMSSYMYHDLASFITSTDDLGMIATAAGFASVEEFVTAGGETEEYMRSILETTLRSFAGRIQFEESLSGTSQFMGIQLWPTGINNAIFDLYYACASIAAIISEQNETNTLTALPGEAGSELGGIVDMAAFFNREYTSGNITNTTKRYMVEALGNYQSAGYFELGAPKGNNAFNAFNEVNGTVNLLAIRDIAFRCVEDYSSPFSFQWRPYLSTFQTIANLSYSRQQGLTPIDDIALTFAGAPSSWAFQIIDIEEWRNSTTGELEFNEGVVPVGYLVERWEANDDGTVTSSTVGIKYYLDGSGAKVLIDPNVKYGATYYYRIRTVYVAEFAAYNISPAGSSYSSLEHGAAVARILVASRGVIKEITTVKQVLPVAPTDIIFNFDRDRGGMFMHWQYPTDMFKKTAKFQVFSRPNTNEPFRLLHVIDFSNYWRVLADPGYTDADGVFHAGERDPDLFVPDYEGIPVSMEKQYETVATQYVDIEFEVDSKKIYSIVAIDTLGVSSGYSAQFEVTYNTFLRKTEAKYISRSGAPKPYPNIFLRDDTFQDTIKTSGNTSLKIYFDPEYLAASRSTLDFETSTELIENLQLLRGRLESDTPEGGELAPAYKLQMINVDLQQAANFDIVIVDKTEDELLQPAKILPPEEVGT